VALYLHSPNTPSWHGAQLKHRDNFTFTYSSYVDDCGVNNTIYVYEGIWEMINRTLK
jgi:hypothetical protein